MITVIGVNKDENTSVRVSVRDTDKGLHLYNAIQGKYSRKLDESEYITLFFNNRFLGQHESLADRGVRDESTVKIVVDFDDSEEEDDDW